MTAVSRMLRYRAAVMIMGMSGLAAQMSLLREFLVISAGNEMTIGIILANWLIIEAAGATAAGRLPERLLNRSALFALTAGLFCLSLPTAVFGVRVLKTAFGLSIGESPGLGVLFVSSFVLLFPTSLTHGALFPMACGVAPRSGTVGDSPIPRAYLLETTGTLVGGVLWTWLLIPRFHSFEIAVGVAILNGAVCVALLASRGFSLERSGYLGAAALGVSLLVLLGGIGMLVAGGAERLHRSAIAKQWRGQNVVDYRNSIHGNICVVENEGQYSFFTDGTLVLITPVPDTAHVKAYAHIPLTVHPDPQRILLIGSGPGGLIREMLRHPVLDRIDYAELDPLIIELLRTHATDLTESELGSPRVSVKPADGRSHLLRSGEGYDVIVSALGEPSDLQTNRFFTREFFRLAARRLSHDGILVVRFPSGIGFRNPELVDLVASLHAALSSAFPHIRAFPAEGETMVIASADSGVMDYDADRLLSRLAQRGLHADVALPWEIERRLHVGWNRWYRGLVGAGNARVNRDFAPVGVFLSLSYWNSLHAPQLVPLFRVLRTARPWMLAVLLGAITVVCAFARRKGSGTGLVIAPSVFGTGAAGMLFSLSLIFSFQSLFGHLFSWIGLLTAVFMAGSAAGALLMTRRLSRLRNLRVVMVATEAAVLLAAVLLPLIVARIGPILEATTAFALGRVLFLVLPFGCGLLVGAQFPVATGLRERETGRTASTAGVLYAADLVGGWLGGMLGGVILIPVFGLVGTGLSVALLKAHSLVLFVLSLPARTQVDDIRRNDLQ